MQEGCKCICTFGKSAIYVDLYDFLTGSPNGNYRGPIDLKGYPDATKNW